MILSVIFRCFSTLFIATSGFAIAGYAQSVRPQTESLKSSEITIQELNLDKSEKLTGTVFYLELPGYQQSEEIFTSPHSSRTYFVRVNGVLHKVKRLSTRGALHGKVTYSVGQHLVEVWGNSRITLKLDCHTISVSEEADEFKGELTITIKGHKATFKIYGTNGC